jgi:ferredoxin-thioredoxin reductase catalytic chain
MPATPTPESLRRIEKLVQVYCGKSGTSTHPDPGVTQVVINGLAANLDAIGRPLCPCRFYPDKKEEATHRTWICACDDMQIYKYCHCLLFVNEEGLPITEYLPAGHPGVMTYGIVKDPTPDKGRPLRNQADAREIERRERNS